MELASGGSCGCFKLSYCIEKQKIMTYCCCCCGGGGLLKRKLACYLNEQNNEGASVQLSRCMKEYGIV